VIIVIPILLCNNSLPVLYVQALMAARGIRLLRVTGIPRQRVRVMPHWNLRFFLEAIGPRQAYLNLQVLEIYRHRLSR